MSAAAVEPQATAALLEDRQAIRTTEPPRYPLRNGSLIFESFQKHLSEIADVSPTLETFPFCKYPSRLDSLRNGIEEADGSIPFISTK